MNPTHKIEAYLEQHNVPYDILPHRHSATSIDAAHSAQVDPQRMAKAVLLEGDGCIMAAMLPADRKIRLGELTDDYGPRIHLADEGMIRTIFTDCDPGAVPGLPMAWGVETLWDDELLAQPDIYLDSGDHMRLIHVKTQHLQDLIADMPHCHFCVPMMRH